MSADLRDRIAAAIWERQNPGRRYADCEPRWRADAEADADAVLAAVVQPKLDKLTTRIEEYRASRQRWMDAANADRRASNAAAEELATVRAIANDFVDPDPCWYDHHGYCQAHGWFAVEPRCPHARAREMGLTGEVDE